MGFKDLEGASNLMGPILSRFLKWVPCHVSSSDRVWTLKDSQEVNHYPRASAQVSTSRRSRSSTIQRASEITKVPL